MHNLPHHTKCYKSQEADKSNVKILNKIRIPFLRSVKITRVRLSDQVQSFSQLPKRNQHHLTIICRRKSATCCFLQSPSFFLATSLFHQQDREENQSEHPPQYFRGEDCETNSCRQSRSGVFTITPTT